MDDIQKKPHAVHPIREYGSIYKEDELIAVRVTICPAT